MGFIDHITTILHYYCKYYAMSNYKEFSQAGAGYYLQTQGHKNAISSQGLDFANLDLTIFFFSHTV